MDNNTIEKINEIRQRADIVDVISRHIQVIRKGKSFTALCPFHNDNHPSLSISRDKQIFKCFVCNTGGNVFSFVSKFRHIPYMNAVKEVADLVGVEFTLNEPRKEQLIDTKKKILFDIIKDATAFYKNSLVSNKEALDYATSRNLDQKILNDFNIGFSPDGDKLVSFLTLKGYSKNDIYRSGLVIENNGKLIDRFAGRLIFPLNDLEGNIVAFSGRLITKSDMAKYVNSPETEIFIKGNTLYNYHNAITEIKKEKHMYIVEGFMDCIAMYRSGILNCVALMGTAFTKEHLKLLKYLGVSITLCLDGDNPGISNANKLANELASLDVEVSIVPHYEDVKDLGEFFDKYGPEKLNEHIKNSQIGLLDFEFFVAKRVGNLDNNEEKKEFLRKMCKKISSFKDEDKDIYVNKLHDELKFSLTTIRGILNEYINAKSKDVIRGVKDYKKMTKKQELQIRVLSQMFDSPEAIQIFIDSLIMLEDDSYRRISLLIGEYYQENKDDFNIDNMIADLVTKIEAEQDDNESLKETLLLIDNQKEKYPPFKKNSFTDLLYEISEITPLEDELAKIQEDIRFETDDQKKKELVARGLSLKESIKAKRNNKINIYD